MPRTGGGICFIYGTGAGGGSGCPSRHWLARIPTLSGYARYGVYFAQVKPEIATIELRFRNGVTEQVAPIDGFVLHKIPSSPVSVVGLSRRRKAIFRGGGA